MKRQLKAFTLIELLIVVAIIAILAAIAVPNFLEAQTRAKVSRVRADIRSAATALEAYYVDNNKYPPTPFWGSSGVLRVIPTRLSTPIAYVTSANFQDPFISANLGDFQYYPPSGTITTYTGSPGDPEGYDPVAGKRYYYQSNSDQRRSSGTQLALQAAINIEGFWAMASMGPDRDRDLEVIPGIPADPGTGLIPAVLVPYDPSNGTNSSGDIVRTQKQSEGTLKP